MEPVCPGSLITVVADASTASSGERAGEQEEGRGAAAWPPESRIQFAGTAMAAPRITRENKPDLGARRSALGARRSALGARRSELYATALPTFFDEPTVMLTIKSKLLRNTRRARLSNDRDRVEPWLGV